jgi:hypothetical protein
LVVSVQRAEDQMSRQGSKQGHHAMAHQRLAAGDAQLSGSAGDKGGAQAVELLEREQIPARQKLHVFGHAIDAAQIAAVGHRHAQIGDGAAEGVDERRRLGGRESGLRTKVHGGQITLSGKRRYPRY